jgi:hypothetical protein
MKNVILGTLLCFLCCACSGGNRSDSEKGKIEKFTEQVGKGAAEGIKKPIDKARKIDEMAKERIKNLERQEAQGDE